MFPLLSEVLYVLPSSVFGLGAIPAQPLSVLPLLFPELGEEYFILYGGPRARCIAVYYLTPFWVLLFYWHNILDKKTLKEFYERR